MTQSLFSSGQVTITLVGLTATKVTAEEELKEGVKYEKRLCYFEDEFRLKLHRKYTQVNCFLETSLEQDEEWPLLTVVSSCPKQNHTKCVIRLKPLSLSTTWETAPITCRNTSYLPDCSSQFTNPPSQLPLSEGETTKTLDWEIFAPSMAGSAHRNQPFGAKVWSVNIKTARIASLYNLQTIKMMRSAFEIVYWFTIRMIKNLS